MQHVPRNRPNKDQMTTKEYTNTQIAELIDEYIHSERDRRIMKSRYIDGLTFKELEDKYHLSERRIKAICYKEFDRLLNHI